MISAILSNTGWQTPPVHLKFFRLKMGRGETLLQFPTFI